MGSKYKSFNYTACLIEVVENQRTRYQEYHYHPYDYINKPKVKEKTNNIR